MSADLPAGATRPNGHRHPRLVHVQTPATLPAPPAPHPDQRHQAGLQAAWQAGHEAAERPHYVNGWRQGVGHGLLAGLLLGCLGMWAALQLGRLWGAP